MAEKLKSEGKCPFCPLIFLKAGITKHLNQHLDEMQSQQNAKTNAYHLRIESKYDFFPASKGMFLNLLVAGNAPLADLDEYLRNIWLECCGHLSSFCVKGKYYEDNWDDMGADIGEKKKTKMEKVFQEGMEIKYEYDFGSTTELIIKVIKAVKLPLSTSVEILSRNEPLAIMCDICKTKPAVELCAIHLDDEDGAFFCEDCAEKHAEECEDFADYASMPVVNSPRMGTCAYEGGAVDMERDGVYKG